MPISPTHAPTPPQPSPLTRSPIPTIAPARHAPHALRVMCALQMLAAVLAAVLIELGAPTASAQPSTPPAPLKRDTTLQPNILIVASYDRTATSSRSQENAILEVLDQHVPRARVRSEYLTTARKEAEGPGPDLLASLTQSLRLRVENQRYDLVIVIDTLAMAALAGPGRDLVADRPVVFSGLTWDQAALADAHLNATGVFERLDGRGTVELIQQLLPRTRSLLAMSYGMSLADQHRREVDAQINAMPSHPEVRWTKARTLDELQTEVSALGPDSAVLYIAFREVTQDVPGPEAFRMKSPVPAFGVYESNLSPNLVGGRVVSPTRQGRLAGQIAVRVLHGESPASIPPVTNASVVVLNGPELKRWGITAPPGALILNPVAPWYTPIRENWQWVLAACAVQLGIIALLVLNRAQRRRAEQELRASQERYELAIGGTNDAIWDWDIARDRTHRSPRYETLLGYAPGEMAADQFKWEERVHPDDLARTKEVQAAHLRGEERYDVEYRLRMKDGSYRWFRSRGKANHDPDGKPVRMAGSIADIHERVESRNRLRESEERYRRIVETADEGIWMVDTGWRTTFANARMADMLGVTPLEMLGRHIFDFMDEQAREDYQQNMRRREQGLREQHDFRFRRKDGSDLWAIVSTNAILDDAGRFAGALAMVTDVTQRAEVERLNEGQRRVLELIATGASVERTVSEIVAMIQKQAAPAIASVLRLDDQQHMVTLAAPGLPPEYNAAINGLPIGPSVGSCGTAMYLKQRVIVENIAADPKWEIARQIAERHNLRACWSEPLIASDGTVLGSLAMYFNEVRGPAPRDIGIITTAAHLASIAIERARTEDARQRTEATNRALLAANPDMMFRMDRAGRYVGYHAPDPSRLAVPPERFMGRTAEEVLPPNRAAECRVHLDRLFATGQPQMYEYEVVRPEGTRGWWEVRMVRGMQDEALLLLRDVTDRVTAERRVRESEQRLRLLVQSTPLGVVYWDTQFRVTGWNPGAELMFGYTEAEARGRHATFIVPEAARRYVNDILRGLLTNTGGNRGSNQNLRKDGTLVHCEWYNSPLIDQSGHVIGVASVVEDVTERKLVQQRQDFMMAELDHRVKNNLAAVISLAEQTGRGSTDYRQFLDTFMGRVRAMSRMHSVLARSRWKGADLRTLVTQTLEAFGSGSASKTSVIGDSVTLGPRAAQALAMAFNELATNATKYGALSNAAGSVHVHWSVATENDTRELTIRWEETGGPPVTPPARRGFGTQLIEGTIAYELRGTVRTEYAPTGVVCKMVVPLIEEIGPIEEEPGAIGADSP